VTVNTENKEAKVKIVEPLDVHIFLIKKGHFHIDIF